MEYKFDESKFSLKGLTIITRHGERLPLISTSSFDKFDCKASRQVDQTNFEKYQTFVNSYQFKNFTIADKAFNGFPWYPSEFHCEAGNMTADGALQIIRLGSYLSNVYKNSNIFDEAQISITSTINYRTFHSAIAFISAFYFPLSKNPSSIYVNLKASNQTSIVLTTIVIVT